MKAQGIETDGGAAPSASAAGSVLAVNGWQASVRLARTAARNVEEVARVGSFVIIGRNPHLVVGRTISISYEQRAEIDTNEQAIAQIDLLGEIRGDTQAREFFNRGISDYPVLGDPMRPATPEELDLIFQDKSNGCRAIGYLQQNSSIGVSVNVHDLLSRHFAVFGGTGVGKSSGVTLAIQSALEVHPGLRVLLIDPHNEYGSCFAGRAVVLSPRNLRIPFWLFSFEETINVLLRGRPDIDEDVEILADVIPVAKGLFLQRSQGLRADERPAGDKCANIDTPVPYRLQDLMRLLDERMGKLENFSMRMRYHRLINRIEAVSSDPRYSFMFGNALLGGDTMVEVLSQLFRLPIDGKPVTVMQLAGFPSEVVDSIVSVLSRIAFDFGLWSDGVAPLLLVCEEAHRYASADRTLGFAPSRSAIARIAKEGRKYGVFLALVTQRPSELEPTIISQCGTVFAMRLANEQDQAVIRAAASDAAASLVKCLPTLATGEVIAFGEGIALPTRLHFKRLSDESVPRNKSLARERRLEAEHVFDEGFTRSVVERWRGGTTVLKPSPSTTKSLLSHRSA